MRLSPAAAKLTGKVRGAVPLFLNRMETPSAYPIQPGIFGKGCVIENG